jgi:hypothetical protein
MNSRGYRLSIHGHKTLSLSDSFQGAEVVLWCGLCSRRPSCGTLEVDDPIGSMQICYECLIKMGEGIHIPGFTGEFDDLYQQFGIDVDGTD